MTAPVHAAHYLFLHCQRSCPDLLASLHASHLPYVAAIRVQLHQFSCCEPTQQLPAVQSSDLPSPHLICFSSVCLQTPQPLGSPPRLLCLGNGGGCLARILAYAAGLGAALAGGLQHSASRCSIGIYSVSLTGPPTLGGNSPHCSKLVTLSSASHMVVAHPPGSL